MSAIPPDTDTRPSLQDIHSAVLHTTLKTFASTEDCCVICLSELSEGCEALPCHHADFDFLCLTTWLEQQPTCSTCPLCKAEITEIRYDFSSDRAQWKTYHVPPKPAPPPQQQQQQHHRSHDRTRSGPGPHTSPGHFAGRRRFDPLGLRRPRPSLYRTRRARGSAQDDDPLRHRRFVYRNQLYSLRVGSNRVSRYRELTPHMFATDAELVSRARMFLRRELQVFDFLAPTSDTSTAAAADPAAAAERDPVRRRRANNAEFLLEYIVAILKTVDIQGSMGQAEELVREFLGRENTRLLLHELRAWLRSPYMALENWDNAVQYPELRAKRGRSRSRSPSVEGTSRPGREQVTYPSTWRRGDSLGDRPGTSQLRFARE
ncbi:putative RING finger protein C16G5.03 like [Verticillium longisporum]|uniref:RING-type E3 ubiquitin transferase n=1 Tax=Verticillium longisporum TaxID=100787 RepID=A0A8I3A469_VERLO|nr:putative RING finger protein C16G5.03 like [Verticillium longisporum]